MYSHLSAYNRVSAMIRLYDNTSIYMYSQLSAYNRVSAMIRLYDITHTSGTLCLRLVCLQC